MCLKLSCTFSKVILIYHISNEYTWYFFCTSNPNIKLIYYQILSNTYDAKFQINYVYFVKFKQTRWQIRINVFIYWWEHF